MTYPDVTKGPYSITADRTRTDVDAVHAFLTRCFWARGISRELVAKSIEHSLCFGVFDGQSQVAFARVVTDYSTYAYLCDVYVLEEYRGKSLGKWMMEFVMGHPGLQGLRRFQLVTRDAHGLYTRYGFKPPDYPERQLEIFRPGLYSGETGPEGF
jgi:ribosomal protein S18 acetylase RimI-like enzyme